MREAHIRLLFIRLMVAVVCLRMQGTAAEPPQDAATKDPAYSDLAKAFDALRMRDYERAIESFKNAATASPKRTDINKNLAYTYLKVGETEEALRAFGIAMVLDPSDYHVAMEYAFLCYEARDEAPARKSEARRIFARIKEVGDAKSRVTALEAFNNIDQPLADGIARWQRVLETSTPTFSAHYELAQLAEAREEMALAAANYRAAFQLLPERKSVLLELARVEKARGNAEGEISALLAASRGGETRAAEFAREAMPERYPYVYEFRNALALDPKNGALHRELAYLLLQMKSDEAVKEFEEIVRKSPEDVIASSQLGLLYLQQGNKAQAMPLLNRVLAGDDASAANRVRMALQMPLVLEDHKAADSTIDARVLAERSYKAGFMKDALRYYQQAREANPVDSEIALKLGWTNNMLHDDSTALRWFGIARKSTDEKVSSEAEKAYQTLLPALEPIRTTVWIYPLISSRWMDVFGYGQLKSELRLGKLPFRPYLSVRFVGDTRVHTSDALQSALSESSVILAAGVATRYWRGAMGWFEAGTALSYISGKAFKDIRGGLSWSRFRGASLLSERDGRFYDSTADGVFVSRFDNDVVNNWQNKVGWTSSLGAMRMQYFWNANLNFDLQHQYWANFIETGPGVRFRPPQSPASLSITVSMVRGVYLTNVDNPRRPNFWDLKAGVWYAFTK